MLIAEELFLIGIDEVSKKNELKSSPFLFAGAIMFDLTFKKRISFVQKGSSLKGVLVHLEDSNSTGNVLLDEAINEIRLNKKDRPVAHWLSKFKGKKYEKLITDSLVSLNHIQLSGKKHEIINLEGKEEILNNIVNCVLQEQEPDEKLRYLLMLLSLRTVNWAVLSKKIDIKDEKIKNRLSTFQKMNWENEIGYSLTNLDPGITYQ